jgi:hypothetical protein
LGSGVIEDPGPDRWFNPDDFEPVSSGSYRYGTAGRNILLGPSYAALDCALIREFSPFGEDRLQVRAEAFNLLNHVNFYNPEHRIDLPTAATITRANRSRRIQIGLKYSF